MVVWTWQGMYGNGRAVCGVKMAKSEYGYPYTAQDGRENLEAADDVRRVLRGGSFYDVRNIVRCAYRTGASRIIRYNSIGFRVMSPGL